MKDAAWKGTKADLSWLRQDAAAFLDNLPVGKSGSAEDRQNWIARWMRIGDDYCRLGDVYIKKEALDNATEASLCALTAFEIAKRLVDEDETQRRTVWGRIESGIQRVERAQAKEIKQVRIACCDNDHLNAYYFAGGWIERPSAAVICISTEQEAAAALLGRLLPVAIGRGISILVISHDDIADRSPGESEALLSSCLDYLTLRCDVDCARIGIYGEGLSAALATRFAESDQRVAAAVCDGGLWDRTRTSASIGWLTRAAEGINDGASTASRLQFLWQMKCPALVVAGGRGTVSISEAIELQADCMTTSIKLDLVVPRVIRSDGAEVENFVTSDDCIFEWLEHKLADASAE